MCVVGPLDDGGYQKVKISSMHRNKVPCKSVRASQSASLQLNDSVHRVRKGMVLLGLGKPMVATWYFQVCYIRCPMSNLHRPYSN